MSIFLQVSDHNHRGGGKKPGKEEKKDVLAIGTVGLVRCVLPEY